MTLLVLSSSLAVLANQKIRGLTFYRSAHFRPPVAGIIWLFIFHPSYGILNYALAKITAYEFNWLLKGWVALLW